MTDVEIGIIKDFISKRFKHDNAWSDGNCYWAAWMIKERFPSLKIYYIADIGHFVAGDTDRNVFFDAHGIFDMLSHSPFQLDWIYEFEPSWYERLMKDCRN